ncbi:MAG TPA: metallopeptidase TldD-related protein [Bryobacteraceae bacterium]|jgi:predicted Zn-dependent protease|nr:metallopeptidase TldD-related protein [Bryobacteraceae bacterium]
MISENESRALIQKIISYSKLSECEVQIQSTESVFIRFANNGITTSGYQVNQQVSITSTTPDKRSGNAVVSEISDDSLQRGLAQAEDLARISQPDPEHVAPLGPQQYPKLDNFDAFTASARGEVMIPHVKAILDAARSHDLTAAGFATRTATAAAVGNKAGLFGYTTYTDSSLTNTMRNKGGTSSGWATQVSTSIKDLNGGEVASRSTSKCLHGAGKRKLEAGKYTVILEPAAVSDLIGFFGFGIDARSAEQGQSFLSKKGHEGETLVGEKLFPEYITLLSDPFNKKLSSKPWGDSLLPNERMPWVERGVMKNMYWDRFWAEKAKKQPTPAPFNLTLVGQENSLDDLIKSVDKGLLVTRFWYIRMLQPQTLQVTGLTRDGVFLVENGKVTDPVMNFRWNESPVRVLQNTKKLTRPIPVAGAETGPSFAPALVATDFNFASISDAV